MTKTQFKSVEEYLAQQPEEARGLLEKVRGAIRKAVPGAEESISYNIPTYKLGGKAVVYFAGWKKHYSIYPASAAIVKELEVELSPYEIEKGTIRFPLSKPVPVKLIGSIAKLRAREAAAKR